MKVRGNESKMMETKDSHEFIVRTNEQYAAWCKTHYQPDALDRRGMMSLHGLWAWQEQERRRVKEIEALGICCAFKVPGTDQT